MSAVPAGLVVAQTNSITRGGLTGNDDIGMGNSQRFFEVDIVRNAKHDDSRALGLDGGAQAAGAGIVEVGHRDDLSTPAAGRVGAETFRALKGGKRCSGPGCRALYYSDRYRDS